MHKNNQGAVTEQLVSSILRGMSELKAGDIKVLDLSKLENSICSYFVICHGDSNTHVNGIADKVAETVKKEMGQRPMHSEGRENATWVLLDYFDVLVHVFYRETREFYNIEALWADANEVPVNIEKEQAI